MVTALKTVKWPEDSTCVIVSREEDLLFWSNRFQVSPGMLRHAVRIVGSRFKDVSDFLTRKRQA
jgi:hypothetical protein